eukprot:109374_1
MPQYKLYRTRKIGGEHKPGIRRTQTCFPRRGYFPNLSFEQIRRLYYYKQNGQNRMASPSHSERGSWQQAQTDFDKYQQQLRSSSASSHDTCQQLRGLGVKHCVSEDKVEHSLQLDSNL